MSTHPILPFASVSPTPSSGGAHERGENRGQTPVREPLDKLGALSLSKRQRATVPSSVPPHEPSPLRWLRALLTRLLAAAGPTLENEILAEQLAREQAEVAATRTEAETIEGLAAKGRRDLATALADGAIDRREKALLTRDHRALAAAASGHTHHLRYLSE